MEINDKIKELIKTNRRNKVNLNTKEYYKKNKDRLIERACESLKCDLCGRSVIRNNLKKHQTYKICMKYAEYKRIVEQNIELN